MRLPVAHAASAEVRGLLPSWSFVTVEWLDQIPTFGGHSTFAPETLDELLSGTRATIDEIGGSFTMRYAALALTARRTADPAVTA